MRIAHIITRMIVGGAQENTLLTCQGLVRDFADDVLLITGPAEGPEGDLLLESKGAKVPVTMIPRLRRAIHPWHDLSTYFALRRELQRFRPEVVHTHSAKGGFLGRLAATSIGVPAVVHTVHGAPFHSFQNKASRTVFRWCESYAATKCHALVSVADAMTDQLVKAGVAPREKFTTIYSGMDVQPFLGADRHRDACRGQFGFEPDDVVIGKIARLFHLKGHEYLIEAASEVVRRCPQVRFLLVGDGVLRDQLEERIRQLGLSQHFRFTGLVRPQEIPRLLGAMDILVHCSLREGLARALPQALIAGKPVVSYDVDGAREVVIDGETGCLLPPQSIEPLTEALCNLADNREQRRQLGECGQRRFTEQFRHESMTASLRRLYEDLLPES
jgi:glycosyltransferase involved in cell wall biosynthesis